MIIFIHLIYYPNLFFSRFSQPIKYTYDSNILHHSIHFPSFPFDLIFFINTIDSMKYEFLLFFIFNR